MDTLTLIFLLPFAFPWHSGYLNVPCPSLPGQTYLSTSGISEVSLRLGAFWQTTLTVGLCPASSPLDILLTDDRGSNLTGLTVSNSFQNITLRAGPLYYEHMSDVHVHIPVNGHSNTYSSVFSISIEGMIIAILTHNTIALSFSK